MQGAGAAIGREEIPHIQGQEQRLHFTGAAMKRYPHTRSGAAAVLHWTGLVEIPHIQGQKNPSKTVGTEAAMRKYLTSKDKGEAPTRW